MSVWDMYEKRMTARGLTKRETALQREKHALLTMTPDGLFYHQAIVDGIDQPVEVIDSDNLNEKTICSVYEDVIRAGSLVEWADNHWLVTECDANNEVYTRAKMIQCNYLLKWVDDNDKIISKWCIVEDGTKYLTGEYEDRNFIVARGDSRIAITIAKDEDTVKLGRENRFLVDDPDSKEQLAYVLSKPMKAGHVYNSDGVYIFVLQEVVTTDYDNQELGIADYYHHFPREGITQEPANPVIDPENNVDEKGRKVWL